MSESTLPKILRNFNVFLVKSPGGTTTYFGKATSVTLPKLVEKTEEYRPAGYMAPVEIGLGFEKLELELTISEYSIELIKSFGFYHNTNTDLKIKGALKNDIGPAEACIVEVSGRIKSIDMGEWTPERKTEMKVMLNCHQYKLTIGSEVAIEVDIPQNIQKIGGTDLMAEINQIIKF
jgi:P2 family phage contractile tail tube protein